MKQEKQMNQTRLKLDKMSTCFKANTTWFRVYIKIACSLLYILKSLVTNTNYLHIAYSLTENVRYLQLAYRLLAGITGNGHDKPIHCL